MRYIGEGKKERPRVELPPAHQPRKSLGQNFLIDQNVLSRIVESCDLSPEDTVLEIGPGRGALTRELMPRVKQLILVEKDRVLAQKLQEEFSGKPVMVHGADILNFNLDISPSKLKAVGNLPYNISTEVFRLFLNKRSKLTSVFSTVQLEFGQKLVAPAGDDSRSYLSCLAQFYADPKILFRISSKSFSPAPKVTSCFVRMDIREKPLVRVRDEALFDRIVLGAFSMRRKTILNAMSSWGSKEDNLAWFARAGVSPQARAEDMEVEAFARLANER